MNLKFKKQKISVLLTKWLIKNKNIKLTKIINSKYCLRDISRKKLTINIDEYNKELFFVFRNGNEIVDLITIGHIEKVIYEKDKGFFDNSFGNNNRLTNYYNSYQELIENELFNKLEQAIQKSTKW